MTPPKIKSVKISIKYGDMHRIYPSISASCWRCNSASADFTHIFWNCPYIESFWVEVTKFILTVTTVPVPLSIEVCLLGLVEPLAPRRALRTLLGLLLYYARKSIVLRWKASSAPSLNFWKKLVNAALPLYKATYLSRGCGKKFHKIWDIWTESLSTNADSIDD